VTCRSAWLLMARAGHGRSLASNKPAHGLPGPGLQGGLSADARILPRRATKPRQPRSITGSARRVLPVLAVRARQGKDPGSGSTRR
jgi:hypothetical protein